MAGTMDSWGNAQQTQSWNIPQAQGLQSYTPSGRANNWWGEQPARQPLTDEERREIMLRFMPMSEIPANTPRALPATPAPYANDPSWNPPQPSLQQTVYDMLGMQNPWANQPVQVPYRATYDRMNMYDSPEWDTFAAAPPMQKSFGVVNAPGRGIDYNAPVAQELLRRLGYFVGF